MKNKVNAFQIQHVGFTLAELLIALAILGIIAVFAIPKILSTQQNGQSNAKAKEAVSMVAAAMRQYQLGNQLTGDTTAGVLTQYMNYVSVKNSGLIDDVLGADSRDCGDVANYICLNLHNGGTLWMERPTSFGGVSTTNVLPFMFDPDGVASGSVNDSPGKSVLFLLHYNGRITSGTNLIIGSSSSIVTWNNPWLDPSWFYW